MTSQALSPDTDRRLVDLVIERGLATRADVQSVSDEHSVRLSRGERLGSLAQLLCERGVLARSDAAALLAQVRARPASPGPSRAPAGEIGGYRLVSELGRGGMGVVFRAHRAETGEVAVKILGGGQDLETIAGFEREKRLLLTLGLAEGFVPVLDSGVSAGRPYLVMPLFVGGTLRQRLAKGGPLDVDSAIAIFRQLAWALGRAHARGIVHRDVKPENVLFSADARPLVSDLGLAKHFRRDLPGASQSLSLSGTDMVAGTPGYMAPEQIDAAETAGPPADVFALGVMLYESIAGERPFQGAGILGYVSALRSPHERLRSRVPAVPAWLDAIVERALARDPRQRFADAGELERALTAGAPRRGGRRGVAIGLGLLGLAALALPLVLVAVARTRPGENPAVVLAPVPAKPPRPEPAPPRLPDPAARALLERANHEFERHEIEAALADYTRVLALDPLLAEAWAHRGFARGESGNWTGAVADFARAVELDPTNTETINNCALARVNTGEWAAAVADWTRYIALDPKDAYPWLNRAAMRVRAGDPDGAIADATQALSLDPDSVPALINRGAAHEQRNDPDAAIKDCTRAIELGTDNKNVWHIRGAAHQTKHETEAAIADLEHFLALGPNELDANDARKRLGMLRSR